MIDLFTNSLTDMSKLWLSQVTSQVKSYVI